LLAGTHTEKRTPMKNIQPTNTNQPHLLWIISPPVIALFSGFLALLCSFIPRAIYKDMVGEPFSFFLNLPSLIYITLCIASFILGYFIFMRFLRGMRDIKIYALKTTLLYVQPFLVLSSSVALLITLASLATTLLLISSLSFRLILQGVSGEISSTVVRQGISGFLSENRLRWVIVSSQVVSPWLLWLYWCSKDYVSSNLRSFAKYVLVGLLTSSFINLVLLQNRGPMISYVMCLLLIYFLHLSYLGRLSFGRIFRRGLFFVLFGVAYFMIIQITRYVGQDVEASQLVIAKIMGYYAGSYNRLTSLMDGWLMLPGSYHGYYWMQWFWEFPVLSELFGLKQIAESLFITLPVSGAVERSPYILAAGLNGSLTSITIFSHAFIDFGWLGWIAFFPYGILAGFLWHRFLLGDIWGVCLYPYMLWTIIEWRGYIEITRPSMPIAFLIPALLLFLVRMLSLPRSQFQQHPRISGDL
jgi:hypothetical protein